MNKSYLPCQKVKDQDPDGGVVTASKYDLLASSGSDIEFKDCHHTPVRNLVEFESSSHTSDYLSSPMFNRSEERTLSYTDFETNYSHKSQPWDSIREPDSIFGGTSSFNSKNDVTLSFMFNECRSVSWNRLNDLGLTEKEPNPDTLGEDFDGIKDEMNLPITYKSTKPDIMAPALLTSLRHSEEQNLDDMLGECRLSFSSLLPNQPRDSNSTLDFGLTRYQEYYKFGKYAYGEKEDLDIDFNHALFSLSYNRDYLKPAEDCSRGISYIRDSIELSPYQQWFTKVPNDCYHHPDREAWLSSTLNFISGRKCLSLTSSCLGHQISNYGTLEFHHKESSVSAQFLEQDQYGENHREMLNHFREDMLEIYSSSFLHTPMERNHGCLLLGDGGDDINDQEQIHEMLL
ncbi:hypothetical protein L6164_033522 [Bauhinia variegata]|uniref:Uncharacterized protein n=1 Tax=Bauhinia variegata TaxID=167791 RepID=A0ACB9KSC7_BAUVA|nr:hypothetical protein L6164_033522 [Bauhinia variegata]